MLPILPPTLGARYLSLLLLGVLLGLPSGRATEAQAPGKQAQFLNPDAPADEDATPLDTSSAGQEGNAVLVADTPAAQNKEKEPKAGAENVASAGSGYYLSLEEAVELAIQKNLNLLESRLSDRLSDIGVRESWAQYYPTFNSSLVHANSATSSATGGSAPSSGGLAASSGVPSIISGGLTTASGGLTQLSPWGTELDFALSDTISSHSTNNTGTAAVNVRQPLWKGRGTDVGLAAIRTARINRLISRGSLDLSVQQLIFNVRSAYANIIRAIQNREVDQQAVRSAKSFRELTETRYQAGQVTQLEVFNAEVQVHTNELAVVTDETTLETAFDRLKQLLDVDLEEKLRVDAPIVDFGDRAAPDESKVIISDESSGTVYLKVTKDGKPVGEQPVLSQATHFDESVILQEALHNRIDLLNARRTLAVQKLQALLNKDGLGHQIDLLGSYARDTNGRALVEADNGKQANTWSAGISATFPWGKIKDRAAYERALLALEKTEIDLKLARTAVQSDVRVTMRTLRQDEKGLLIGGQQVEQAKLAVAAVKVSFEHGLKDSFAVIQAEDALLAAKRDFVNRKLDYVVQLAQLELVVGKPTGRVEMSGQSVGGLVDSKLPESLRSRPLPKPAPDVEARPEDDPFSTMREYRKDYKADCGSAIIIKDTAN